MVLLDFSMAFVGCSMVIIFKDFQRFSLIFNDFLCFSMIFMIFNNLHCLSMISIDFIGENHWKQWRPLNIKENHWKSMKTIGALTVVTHMWRNLRSCNSHEDFNCEEPRPCELHLWCSFIWVHIHPGVLPLGGAAGRGCDDPSRKVNILTQRRGHLAGTRDPPPEKWLFWPNKGGGA